MRKNLRKVFKCQKNLGGIPSLNRADKVGELLLYTRRVLARQGNGKKKKISVPQLLDLLNGALAKLDLLICFGARDGIQGLLKPPDPSCAQQGVRDDCAQDQSKHDERKN